AKAISGAAVMVYPRPRTRLRASSTITERPEAFSAFAAPRPAAPAPMMAMSTSEGRDMQLALARWFWGMKPALPPLSSSAKADDPVRPAASVLSQAPAITGCPAFAGHDGMGLTAPLAWPFPRAC